MHMKQFSKITLLSFLLAGIFVSCKKDENQVFFEGGKAPALTSSATGSTIPLSFGAADNVALRLDWTNPDYQLNTGISSQDVNYIIEFDKAGANFSSANKQSVAISKDLSMSFKVSVINDYLLNQLLFAPGVPRDIEIRVMSSLGNPASATLYSNTLKYSVTPYAIPPKVEPPASGKLFVTGAATPASWMTAGDPENANQKFTQMSPTLYVLPNIALTGGQSYLLVPVYGDWGSKYGGTGANNANNVNGDDFKLNGGDLLSPAASGNYKIEVDFQRGKFTLTKL